jgi:uncharacterized protein (DUF433 family)
MVMTEKTIAVPLFDDGQGGLRVAGTRVQLERIVEGFNAGDTPETIVQNYDTLNLPAVYSVLAWYLQNQNKVDEYLRWRAEKAEEFRRQIESKQPDRASLKARLLARAQRADHAAPAQ